MKRIPLRAWVRSLLLMFGMVGLLFSCSGDLQPGGYLNLTLQCSESSNCLAFGPNLTCKDNQCICPSPNAECPPRCISDRQGGAGCVCVDLQLNLQNCGACGNRCPPGEGCCNGTCSDVKNDTKNCGACGTACGAGETCCQGICCASGETCCDGRCIATNVDPRHCGACGQECSAGGVCCNGQCCSNQQQCCGDQCVSILTDATNCGSCGKTCEEDATCCNGDCIETNESAKHCGDCGNSCGTFSCCDGVCCSASANTCCDEDCANLQTDRKHCGACGKECESNEVCCQGACTDLQENSQHCGRCGNSCGDASASKSLSLPITRDGEENMLFEFTGLRAPNPVETLQLKVDVYGDFNSPEEKATIKIGTQELGTVGGGEPQCNTSITPAHTTTIKLPRAAIIAGKLTVRVDLDSSVGVSICKSSKPNTNIPRVDVTVLYGAATCCEGQCLDLQSNLNHCGDCGTSCNVGEQCCQGKCCQSNETCSNLACIFFYNLTGSNVSDVSYSPNSNFIAASGGKNVRLWGLRNLVSSVRTLPIGSNITRIAFNPASQALAVADTGGFLSIWETSSGKRLQRIPLNSPAQAVAYRNDGRRLAAGTSKGTITLLDPLSLASEQVKLHNKAITHIAYHPVSNEVLSGSQDNKLLVWDSTSKKILHTLKFSNYTPWDFAISPDNKTLAVLWSTAGQIVHEIRLYNTTNYKLITSYNSFVIGTRIYRISWSADSKQLAWSENLSNTNVIHVWDVATSLTAYKLQDPTVNQNVVGVSFHPKDTKRITSSHTDGKVRRWRVSLPEKTP